MIEQLTLDALRGPDPLADAIAWRDANPRAFDQIVRWAREEVACGARPSIDLYANLLRRPHFARKLGLVASDAVYKVNNDLRSTIARLVMRDFPDLDGTFETRRSRVEQGGGAMRD